ncbi:hypothetical protein GCM10009804_31220 [Kribbella hippodromi]|uniref:Uncharacterized protein n=1 Tax=Kribbella hippodromi TaxID=434347 RepID=A0ABN2D8D4_9ACTN
MATDESAGTPADGERADSAPLVPDRVIPKDQVPEEVTYRKVIEGQTPARKAPGWRAASRRAGRRAGSSSTTKEKGARGERK